MTVIPVPQRTNNQKVSGTFYPLQKEELMALKKARLINNTAYVHLALRFENPFCDRPITIIPKEFARRWNIPESSVYEALGKLRKLGVLKIEFGKVVVRWFNSNSQQDSLLGASLCLELGAGAPLSDNPESILESQNQLPDSRKVSETSENQNPKPLPDKEDSPSQTLQNIQTTQTEKVDEKISSPTTNTTTTESKSNLKPISQTLAKPKKSVPRNENNSQIPADLKEKLEQLEIPLDSRVIKAIANHHISQAYGAVAHVEKTWETIENPRGVFLFQISKQPVENLGARGRVYTAADWGWTLEDVKRRYPTNWREAAPHFGVSLED
ncbi:MAG: hypothetical protein QNJ54_35930 [Prochloraceae cyanobacterium]|nr:hypothetical protein [Prochloraceae cyanobacterium]